MAGGGFDPEEFAAFKGAAPAPSAGGFDPAEFEAFKTAPPAASAPSGDPMKALQPFYERGVSTRNSAGQLVDEARAALTREGVNPALFDQKTERALVSAFEAGKQNESDGPAAVGRGLINGVPVVGPALLGGINRAAAFTRAVQRGTSYTDELKNVEAYGERLAKENPTTTTLSEIGGGVLGTVPLVAAAPAAFGAGTAALPVRMGASMLTGGAMGGADAAARGQDAATGTVAGGALGVIAPVAAAGIGRAVGAVANRARPAPVPTVSELKDTARAAYQRADDAGVQVAEDSFAGTVKAIAETLKEAGLDKTIHPKATAALGRLTEAAGTEPTLKELDLLRRVAKGAAGSIEPDEKRLAKIMVDRLDDYVGGLQAGDLVSGNAEVATEALSEARKFWARAKKAQTLDNAVASADLQAASTGSGGNTNNATRQAIRRILNNPKLNAGYTAEELEQMEAIVRGTTTQNALRLIGKMSPTGNGLMAALGLGATAANPVMAIAPMAGMAAKRIADRGTVQAVNRLNEMVRNGGAVSESPAAIEARRRAELLAAGLLAPAPALANQLR